MARFAITMLGGAILAAGSLVGGASAASGGDGVLVIGDSLGVGGKSYLEAELDGVAVTTDAEIGRASAAGLEVLAASLSDEHAVVAFLLGSNDDPANPDALAASLEQANALTGGRCLIVATVSISRYNGSDDSGLNEAIRSFAAANPNVRLVEWEKAVRSNPEFLSDGAHATPEGYALRASLIEDAIASCTAPASPSAGGDGGSDGIPNPDPDALAEGETRPELDREAPEPDPISRDRAFRILADAVSSQIAIGALG